MDCFKIPFWLFLMFLVKIGLAQEIFPNLPVGVPNSENQQCKRDSDLFVASLGNLTLWAQESKYKISSQNKKKNQEINKVS